MATRKIYRKGDIVKSIDELINNKHKPLIVCYEIKNVNTNYTKLAVMSLSTVVLFINNKMLYYATIIEEEIIRKTKPKVIPKAKSNIEGCKVSLKDIYNE